MTRPSSTSSSEPAPGIRRLASRLSLFLPLALLLPGLNAWMDPGNVLGRAERERGMAEELLSGRSIRVAYAYDEMLLQRRYAESARRRPDVLVLGSSRSMPVSSASFAGRSLWNGSVSSASLEDYVAIAQVFEDRGLRPRSVVLGLDPWILSATLRNPSVALDAELQRGLARLGMGGGADRGALPRARSSRTRFLELLSPAYFQASLSGLASGGPLAPGRGRRAESPEPGPPTAAAGNLVHPDGSVEWGAQLTDATADKVRQLARAQAAQPPPYLRASALLPERERMLEALVGRMQSDGVAVAFWLAPLHPDTYRPLSVSERTAVLVTSEAYFRGWADAQDIPVLGSYDPDRAGARPEDFVDHHHLRRAATERLLGTGAGEGAR